MKLACKLFILATVATLTACASSHYTKNSLFGGYTDYKFDESHYLVSYQGNANTPKERVSNFWIYRCAELTKENGFSYFSVEEKWSNEKTSFNYNQSNQDYHLAENNFFIKASTAASPMVFVPITKWHSRARIAMFNNPVPASVPFVYRAQSILDDLDEYIKSHGNSQPKFDQSELLMRALVVLKPTGVKL